MEWKNFFLVAVMLMCVVVCSTASAVMHTADTDESRSIDLSEVLRVVQLFNAEGLHCSHESEDGFAPGAGSYTCEPHASDYAPTDGIIDFGELLRIVQFYNANGYRDSLDTEDGFAPKGTGLTERGSFRGNPLDLMEITDTQHSGNLVFTVGSIGASKSSLAVVDTSDASNPTLRDRAAFARDIETGDVLWADSGLPNAQLPTFEVLALDTFGPNTMAYIGLGRGEVCCLDWNAGVNTGILQLNVSNPDNIQYVQRWTYPHANATGFTDLEVFDADYLVGTLNNAFVVIDKTTGTLVASLDTSSSTASTERDVLVRTDRVFVSTGDEIASVDMSTPTVPVVMDILSLRNVAMDTNPTNTELYTFSRINNMWSIARIDVSGPNMVLLSKTSFSELDTPRALAVSPSGDHLYAGLQGSEYASWAPASGRTSGGIVQFDITTPAPLIIDSLMEVDAESAAPAPWERTLAGVVSIQVLSNNRVVTASKYASHVTVIDN